MLKDRVESILREDISIEEKADMVDKTVKMMRDGELESLKKRIRAKDLVELVIDSKVLYSDNVLKLEDIYSDLDILTSDIADD